MKIPQHSTLSRAAAMIALVAAGEAAFFLPFVLPRVFRPTLLDVFGLTNLELGTAFSVYGVVAMVSYFLGGPLADYFSARKLMASALASSSLGGAVLATIPPAKTLLLLYGFWGATTVLLFWAALIRATREWGGSAGQGRAFGFLDGGRGLCAALLSSLSVFVLASLLPADVAAASLAQRTDALILIIWLYTGLTFASAVLVWVAVPDADAAFRPQRLTLQAVRRVIGLPAVWMHAVIVVCGYVAYKSTDLFSLYARDVYGYDEVVAAEVGTLSLWVRPVAAITAGYLGDRLGSSRLIVASFGLVIAGCLAIALGLLPPGVYWILIATVAGISAAIYAIRGLYFALFGEAKLPFEWTGSATGLVSVIGYTPDVFMGPLTGYLLDGWPGETGHQLVFACVGAFAAVGLATTVEFRRQAVWPRKT